MAKTTFAPTTPAPGAALLAQIAARTSSAPAPRRSSASPASIGETVARFLVMRDMEELTLRAGRASVQERIETEKAARLDAEKLTRRILSLF